MKIRVFFFSILASAAFLASPALGALDLATGATWLIPAADSQQWFSNGGALSARVNGAFSESPFVWGVGVEASWLAAIPSRGILTAAVVPELGYRWSLASWFSTDLTLRAGYALASRTDLNLGSGFPVLAGSVVAVFQLDRYLQFRFGAGYETYLGLWQGVPVSASFEIPWE